MSSWRKSSVEGGRARPPFDSPPEATRSALASLWTRRLLGGEHSTNSRPANTGARRGSIPHVSSQPEAARSHRARDSDSVGSPLIENKSMASRRGGGLVEASRDSTPTKRDK